jgi:hypothetical protein
MEQKEKKKKEENEKKAVQSLRFNSRRPSVKGPCETITLNAAELFSGWALLTVNPHDIETYGSDDEICLYRLKWRCDRRTKDQTWHKCKHTTGLYGVHFISRAAEDMLSTPSPCLRKALKLRKRGHIVIALLDDRTKSIELFDPSGGDTCMYEEALSQFVPNYKDYAYHFVNPVFLQQEDTHCQTWIYYFLYKRLSMSAPQIVDYLIKLSPIERFHTIVAFWNKLVYL